MLPFDFPHPFKKNQHTQVLLLNEYGVSQVAGVPNEFAILGKRLIIAEELWVVSEVYSVIFEPHEDPIEGPVTHMSLWY